MKISRKAVIKASYVLSKFDFTFTKLDFDKLESNYRIL
jgi:hypothetical protein